MQTILVIFSADAEWQAAKDYYPNHALENCPYGEFFETYDSDRKIIHFQGGWGKIAAAASAQYGIQRWKPDLMINIGTCGGFQGRIQTGQILLVDQTLVYDIVEQMGDPDKALQFYSINLDLNWLNKPYPQPVQRGLLLSADRDILPQDIPWLIEKFSGVAADWESGAIAWVCQRNLIRCLILRGVSDLVSTDGGEVYNDLNRFQQSSHQIVSGILIHLNDWIDCVDFNR
ncbi:MAG: 5'-methylthioadenosine/S-adenosylhomocysteine nucleosidase family protein [Anaerolineaceae bacterium]